MFNTILNAVVTYGPVAVTAAAAAERLRDHHDCPGKNVVKAGVIARVSQAMKSL